MCASIPRGFKSQSTRFWRLENARLLHFSRFLAIIFFSTLVFIPRCDLEAVLFFFFLWFVLKWFSFVYIVTLIQFSIWFSAFTNVTSKFLVFLRQPGSPILQKKFNSPRTMKQKSLLDGGESTVVGGAQNYTRWAANNANRRPPSPPSYHIFPLLFASHFLSPSTISLCLFSSELRSLPRYTCRSLASKALELCRAIFME